MCSTEIEDLNLCVFNMITGKNEPRTLTKHVSRKCEFNFEGKKCKFESKVELQ